MTPRKWTFAAECGVGTLVLTHHRPGQSEAMLQISPKRSGATSDDRA
jgi:hypothetical protein